MKNTKLIQLTKKGKEDLEKEKYIINNEKLPAAEVRLKEAREKGDLSENAEFDAAKEEVETYRSRISEIDQILDNCEVIDLSTIDATKVSLGCKVKINDITNKEKLEYEIVSETEADLSENKINVDSPLAKSIMGKSIGDKIKFEAPAGKIEVEILGISVD